MSACTQRSCSLQERLVGSFSAAAGLSQQQLEAIVARPAAAPLEIPTIDQVSVVNYPRHQCSLSCQLMCSIRQSLIVSTCLLAISS